MRSLPLAFSPRQIRACTELDLAGLPRVNSEALPLLPAARCQALLAWSESSIQTWPRTPLFSPSVCPVLVLDPGMDLLAGHSLKMAREKDVICWEELGCTGKDLS